MKIAKFIAKNKIYLDRARTYMSYIQLLMVLKLFLSDVGVYNNTLILGGLVVMLVLMLVVGWLDTRFGIRSREMENNSIENPVTNEILQRLRKMDNDKKNL